MNRLIFNLAAKTDAAGRPGSPNQDNFWVCPDLTKWNARIDRVVGTDEDVELSEKGALLVVADGMGGMNAGEIASKLVIEGIKKKFSVIPDSILSNENEIQNFIRDAIIESDVSIKQYAKEHKEANGLGSTIVLLWLLNGRAYCGWCGDSRIYRFNPNNELVRLSHDHSYVQSLVDEGKISEEDAFEHPDGNIITKSLGDNGNKAEPELRVYDVYQRDVFLLCSDGLCGLLKDSEIKEVIEETCTSSKDTLKALWEKGEKVGWSDNVTIDLLCILDGGKPAKGRPDGYPVKIKEQPERKYPNHHVASGDDNVFIRKIKQHFLYILAFLSILILTIALYSVLRTKDDKNITNHEYNIEIPENSDNGNVTDNSENNEDSPEGSSQQVENQSSNNNNNSGRRTNPNPNRNNPNHNISGGDNNHNGSTQNNNSGNNLDNNSSQSNGNNGIINQGVIDQLNQNNSANGSQPSVTTEAYPTRHYLDILDAVYNDYRNASSTFNSVEKKGWRASPDDQTIGHFMRNIDNNLRTLRFDEKNFNALDARHKELISSFEQLKNDINRYYYKYPTTPRRRQEYDDSYDGYGGGRSM